MRLLLLLSLLSLAGAPAVAHAGAPAREQDPVTEPVILEHAPLRPIEHMFREIPRYGAVAVAGDPARSALVLRGSPGAVALVKAAAEALDTLAGPQLLQAAEPVLQATTEVLPLQYVAVRPVAVALGAILPRVSVNVTGDPRRNALVMRGTPEAVALVRAAVEATDSVARPWPASQVAALAAWQLPADAEITLEYADGQTQRIGAGELRGGILRLTGPLRLSASTGLEVEVGRAQLEIDKTDADAGTILRLRALPAPGG